MRSGGRGEERDMTMHLIKIKIFTHITEFSMCIWQKQKSLEFQLIQPDDKALGVFLWIWDRVEAYRMSVSCFSCTSSAIHVHWPEMMLDGQFK